VCYYVNDRAGEGRRADIGKLEVGGEGLGHAVRHKEGALRDLPSRRRTSTSHLVHSTRNASADVGALRLACCRHSLASVSPAEWSGCAPGSTGTGTSGHTRRSRPVYVHEKAAGDPAQPSKCRSSSAALISGLGGPWLLPAGWSGTGASALWSAASRPGRRGCSRGKFRRRRLSSISCPISSRRSVAVWFSASRVLREDTGT